MGGIITKKSILIGAILLCVFALSGCTEPTVKEENLLTINTITTNMVSPQEVSKTLNIAAEAIGNGEVQYKFLVEKDGVNMLIQDYSIINTANWTPKETGMYKLIVEVKDTKNSVVSRYIEYQINNALVIDLLQPNKVSPQYIGTTINFEGLANGNGNVQYRYEVLKDNVKTVIQEFSPLNKLEWTPSDIGMYKIILTAKDEIGKMLIKEINYEIAEPIKIEGVEFSMQSPQQTGTTIKIKGEATGIGSIEYRFILIYNGTSSIIKEFSTIPEVIWRPIEAGSYYIYMIARDSTGISTYKDLNYIIVKPMEIHSVLADRVSPQEIGIPINIEVTAQGIGNLEYNYEIIKDNITTARSEFSEEKTMIWNPEEEGTYKIVCRIRDDLNRIVTKEIEYIITKPVDIDGIKFSKLSPQYIGTTINIEGIVPNNEKLEYSYEVEINNIKTVLKEFSEVNSVTWTPEKAGVHKLRLIVKDKVGNIETKEMVYIIKTTLTLNNIDFVEKSPQEKKTAITIKATGVGIGELQYKFNVIKDGIITTINDYSINKEVVWKPEEAGVYIINVQVKDIFGNIINKQLEYVITNPLMLNSIVTSKNSPQAIGNKIEIKVLATGEGILQYKYEIVNNGVTKILEDYSISNIAKWTPTETGAYKIIVSVKNSKGLILTKEMNYIVNISYSQLYNYTSELGWGYLTKYLEKDLYQFNEKGTRTAALSIDSYGYMMTLLSETPESEAIIKNTLKLMLPTEYTKVYEAMKQPLIVQNLELDGKNVRIYESSGYTVAKVFW